MFIVRSRSGLPDCVLFLCLVGVSGSFLLATTVGLLGGLWPALSLQLSVDWRDLVVVREGEPGDTFRQEKRLGLTCFSEGEAGGFGSLAGL